MQLHKSNIPVPPCQVRRLTEKKFLLCLFLSSSQLEQEIQRISEAYEKLMQGSSKRETLEQTLRRRLTDEIRRLQDFNRDLKENLENARTHVAKEVQVADHNQHIMAKLLEQSESQSENLNIFHPFRSKSAPPGGWIFRKDYSAMCSALSDFCFPSLLSELH